MSQVPRRIRRMTRVLRLLCVLLAFAWAWMPGAQAQTVQLEAGAIGVGNMARLGDWAGVEIEFTDSAPTQRELIIQIEGTDSDGDAADVAVPLDPGFTGTERGARCVRV